MILKIQLCQNSFENRSPMSKWQWTTLRGPASGSLRSLWIMDRPGNPGSTLPGMIWTVSGISMSELTCQSPGMTRSSARQNSQRFFPLKVERYLSGLRQVRYKPSYLLSTVEARFSGHRYSGKPRFKGHSSENLGDHLWFLVHKNARKSGKSRQKFFCRIFR